MDANAPVFLFCCVLYFVIFIPALKRERILYDGARWRVRPRQVFNGRSKRKAKMKMRNDSHTSEASELISKLNTTRAREREQKKPPKQIPEPVAWDMGTTEGRGRRPSGSGVRRLNSYLGANCYSNF